MKKHTKQIVALLMIFAVVSIAGCTEKMSAEQIAARMNAQEESIKDFSAMRVTTITVDGNNTTTREKILTKNPDKSRDEFIEPATIAGKVVVKNGSTKWTYHPANNQATKRTLRESEPSKMDYLRLIKGIMDAADISYEGIENVGGRSAYAILVTPHHNKNDHRKSISKACVWIDCKNWMLLRIKLYGVEDGCNVTMTIEYNNVTFNTGIPDSEFIFEAPEGVSLVSDDEVPDADLPSPVLEAETCSMPAPSSIVNWKYVSYRNLSISNAPALNQTARVTYSIIPDRDIEALLVHISFRDGFEFVDVEGERLLTWCGKMPVGNLERCARWRPTNLSKGEMYQFSVTLKAVKTGNWTIGGIDWEDEVYVSVSEDYAYLSDGPFPGPLKGRRINESELERIRANMQADVKSTSSSDGPFAPDLPDTFPPETFPFVHWWNGTAWIEIESPPQNMSGPYWNGTEWVERKTSHEQRRS